MLSAILWAVGGIGGDGGPDLSNLPTDPARAWGVIAAVVFMAAAPVVKAKIDAKKVMAEAAKPAAVPAPALVINGSITPRIDESQQLLATVVGNVEKRARDAETRYDELDKRHVAQVRELARAELQVEMLTARVNELQAEINILHGRLMGSGA